MGLRKTPAILCAQWQCSRSSDCPADELKADVVIVGSRNPGIQTHLLGSEAANIVRYAHKQCSLCADDGGMSP